MIKKIETIKNFAVFDNFNWDSSSTDKNGQPLKFEKINILYGRNYSGKTTLSRIFRSLETGQLPENYDNPQYELIDENGIKTSQNSLAEFSCPVRVFNEDFIKSNLKFLIDPNGEIAPFAILGNNNGTLAEEIKEKDKLLSKRFILRELKPGRTPNMNKTKISKPMSNNVRNFMKREFDNV